MKTFSLWENDEKNATLIHVYEPFKKASDVCVVVLPGGGYSHRAAHEGEGYAQLLNSYGYTAAVVDYRVAPNRFPIPLLDARRALRFMRAHAEEFGISKDKVLVMGSSAGGHLAALAATYTLPIEGEGADAIDGEDFLPSGQILCYPVISSDEAVSHKGSYQNLLGAAYEKREAYSPELLVSEKTPPAFLWHTAADAVVNVCNSYRYATALREKGVSCELHVFPEGPHGLGTAPASPYVSRWTMMLIDWLRAWF
ncbi:MAG: alpha/beta hydrolase [Clostridia bacterium]|nr:alpha/beta hydrolase [Clostridia bacterium]